MIPQLTLTNREQELDNLVIVLSRLSKLPAGVFSTAEKRYISREVETHKRDLIFFNRLDYQVVVCQVDAKKERPGRLESCRRNGDLIAKALHDQKATRVAIFDADAIPDETLALASGMVLGSYRFLRYKTKPEEAATLEVLEIYSASLDNQGDEGPKRVERMNHVHDAVFRCRDLINEPNIHLTATRFGEVVETMAAGCGATAEILTKPKLEALRMGGILGVNQGSVEPPIMAIMEWKPEGAFNDRPLVLVGKGVMYDTGGMNLKPGDTMMNMKDDMSGAAAVAAAIYAMAMAKLPVHVIGLMPATDNRPGDRALVPGDIITMHSGKTVEVVNTDAEGRLLLADALSYASKYDPLLVIDLATLTGSAVRALGAFGIPAMQHNAGAFLKQLMKAGEDVYERMVAFPLWEEYGDLLKSDIADMKNCGPPEAGMITAAKFLQEFTSFPYIHLDIAAPAFLEKRDSYRGQGGTGFGVRLLTAFAEIWQHDPPSPVGTK